MAKKPTAVDFAEPAFHFTEARVAEACRLVAEGGVGTDDKGRRSWRDSGLQGLTLVAGQTGGVFYFCGRVGGKVVRKALGSTDVVTVAEARESVGRLRFDATTTAAILPRPSAPGDRSAEDTTEPTVGEVVSAYLKAHGSGRFLPGRRKSAPTARTIGFYSDVYRATIEADFDGVTLATLAERFPDTFAEVSRRAPYQANRMLQLVRNVYAYAASVGAWDGPNPAIDPGAGLRVTRNAEHPRERFLTDTEAARLEKSLAADLPVWRDLFTVSIVTGQRMGACCRMRWDDLELDGRSPCWRIPREEMKGRRGGHVVPLAGELLRLLRDRRNTVEGEWVFPSPTPRESGPVSRYEKPWRRIIERAGLHSKDMAKRPRPHDLRRTCGARMTAAGVPLPTVTRALGDAPSSVAMVARVYAQVADSALREAYAAIQPSKRKTRRLG
jgi:integrase